MVRATSSACINHPSIEATARCKQCNTPVCGACRISAGSGFFCSEECKNKYEQFVQRAQQLERMRRPSIGISRRLGRLIGKLVIYAIVVLFFGLVATNFGVRIPILSDIVQRLIAAFG
ncbi:MAG: hypothetical protein HY706_20535 [Candidatus Hydrogenedentes bacterium]|nr:hypothetical protein [Candidatus Hydrogenedentota bacterium]